MSSVRAKRKVPVRAVLAGVKVSFPEFLMMWNNVTNQTTPPFHLELAVWYEQTQGRHTRLLQASRDAAKSWMTCLYLCWRLYCDPCATFIVISSIAELATRNAAFIRGMIENHPLTKHLVPVGETELWRRQSFTIVRDKTLPNPSVQALALGSDITGRHADELYADDVETFKNSSSSEERARVREEIKQFRSISPRVTWIGTPHAGSASIYNPLLADPEHCASIQFPAYTEDAEGTRTYLWPENEKLSPDGLALKLHDLGQREFDSQFLLKPANVNTAGLEIEFMHVYEGEIVQNQTRHWYTDEITRVSATVGDHELVDLLCSWDPASGKEDDSVCTIVAKTNKDNTLLHKAIKLPPIDGTGWARQTDEIIKTMRAYGVVKIIVETNTNPALPAELRMAADRVSYKIRVIGIHSTMKKEQRVRLALETAISAGRFFVHASVLETKFREQAESFPACMKGKAANDFIDAAALGVLSLRKLPPGSIINSGLLNYGPTRAQQSIKQGHAGGDVFARLRDGRRIA